MNNKALKYRYRQLHQALSNKLACSFPLAEDMPEDEDESEAQMILARLDEAQSPEQLANIIFEVFVSQFNKSFAAKFDKYNEVAEWLWGERHKQIDSM